MNNCALNLSASVIATAQLSLRRNQYRIVSLLCNYYTLCLGRWAAVVKKQKHTPTSSFAAFHEESSCHPLL